MRWFKHDALAHNDEKIRELIHEFGVEGYGVYMIVLELVAEKIDQDLSPLITVSDQVLREKMRVSRKKLVKILSFFDQKAMAFSKFHGKYWDISCPNLLSRLDNWVKYLPKTNHKLTPNKKKEEEKQQAYQEDYQNQLVGEKNQASSSQQVSDQNRMMYTQEGVSQSLKSINQMINPSNPVPSAGGTGIINQRLM